MNRIYFSQTDSRWAKHPYVSKTHPQATVKSGGCGPTSAAMIVSSLVQTIYPNQMADIFKVNGLRALEGTDPKAFEWIANKYGLKVNKTIYIADAVECLKKGGMCIAYLKAKSLFADGGHIIVLSELRDNNLVIFDPYLYNNKFDIIYKGIDRRLGKIKQNGVETIISVENFKKYCGYTIYCYDAPIIEEKSKYNQGDILEISVPVQITGSIEGSVMGGEDVQIDDGRGKPYSQYWVHESIMRGLKIYARAVVCNVRGKEYMVQVFNRQFWIEEKNIVKKLK